MAGDDDPKSSAHEDDDDDDLYRDLYDEDGPFTEDHLLNVMSDSFPSLMDISFTNANQNPPPLPPPPPPPPPPPLPPPMPPDLNMEIDETLMLQLSLIIPSSDTNTEFDGSFDDDVTLTWEMLEPLNDDLNNNNVQGEIGNDIIGDGNNVGGTGRLEVSTRVFGDNGTNFEIGGTSRMPVDPVTPRVTDGIYLCNCCQPLRGLVHTNGREVTRLDIYGEIGYFCHAILETQPFASSNERRHQTLLLKALKNEDVQKFIEQYCSEREANGFRLVQDTNATFYQAMNAGSVNNQPPMMTMPPPSDVPMSLAMPDAALNVPPVPLYVGLRDEPPGSREERPRRRTPLAAQRERTGKLTLKDIGAHFHLPIEEAARKMDLCPTVLKKICRKGGLSRWPHRKIKSLEKKISALRNVARTATDQDFMAQAEKEIEKIQKQIKEICSEALQQSKEEP